MGHTTTQASLSYSEQVVMGVDWEAAYHMVG